VKAHYVVKPKADLDLDEHADYLARNASLEVALRFLASAKETFSVLALQPNIGWRSRLNLASLKSVKVFRVNDFERMLILYRPLENGVEILRVVHGSRKLLALFRRRQEIG
jgi:toxin ParE1/3/4